MGSVERARVLRALRANGRHATSFQLLEPGFSYWFDPEVADSVVGYVRYGRYRVVGGVPVVPDAALPASTRRFLADTAAAGHRAIFFSADQAFIEAMGPGTDSLLIGQQPEWEPGRYHTVGRDRRTVRAQVARAANKGVRVRILRGQVPDEQRVRALVSRWLTTRRMSAMRFMVDLHLFLAPEERRYYLAERHGRLVGLLVAIPVLARDGWFFEDLVRDPDAPNGTMELLVDAALRDVADASYATLGLAPLAGVSSEPGPHRLLRRILTGSYHRLGALYGFPGLRAFKDRFRPDRWAPQYLVSVDGRVGPGALVAVLRAFAGGGLLAFGWHTAGRLAARISLRAWAVALAAIAALLLPWTAVLAQADGRRWFGDPSVQWAWVAFDLAMAAGLGALAGLVARRHPLAPQLARFLGGAAGTDAVLTAVQVIHLHQAVTGWAAVFVAAGAAGPLLAALLLLTMATVAPIPPRGPPDPALSVADDA